MKLVDINEFYSDFGGGVKTYVREKLESSAELGWETTIIAPGPADRREKVKGGEIIWVRAPMLPPDPRYHVFWRAKAVHALLDEIQPDVIEGSSSWRGGWIAATWQGPAAKILVIHQDPVAVYPHTIFSPTLSERRVDQMSFWFWAYLRKLSAKFDESMVSGEWLASRLEGFGLRRPLVTPFGVDKSLFSPSHRSCLTRKEMLAKCGIDDENAVLFVAVSRHHPEKRLGTVMNAFARFTKNQPAGLYIIGDGPARHWVEKRAAKTPHVFVAGHIGDRISLAQQLASADYMVHGGAAETFGLVVAEALNSGLPLITPNIGGAADLTHPTYAETYRAGDSDALLAALNRIVSRDRNELAVAARAGAHRVHSPRDHFNALLKTYAEIAQQKSAAIQQLGNTPSPVPREAANAV